MTQNEQILAHLRKKPITGFEAAFKYHIMCLAERIRDLRRKGHNIITTTVEKKGKRFAQYTLIKAKE